MKKITILIFASLTMAGCSFLNKVDSPQNANSPQNVISKKQIDSDLHNTLTPTLEGNEVKARDLDSDSGWSYSKDELRCFAPTGDADKITDTTADIYLNIGAEEPSPVVKTNFLYGKILLHYKKENNLWKLEDIDSKDLRTDEIPTEMSEEITKFTAQKIEPLCNYYGVVPDLKK